MSTKSEVLGLNGEPLTQGQLKQQKKEQQQMADRISAEQSSRDAHEVVTTNSVLTTDDHVGKRPDEPHKDPAQEALKVGRPVSGPGVEVVEVSTHESGEATDTVVTSPAPPTHTIPGAAHLHDAVGIGAVREMAKGSDGDANAKPVGLSAPRLVGGTAGEVQTHDGETDEERAERERAERAAARRNE